LHIKIFNDSVKTKLSYCMTKGCYICLQYIFCINGNFLLIFYNYIQDKHFIPKHMTHKICFTPTNK